MLIKVVGKEIVKGISKADSKPFEFTQVYYTTERKEVVGLKVGEVRVYSSRMLSADIEINKAYNLEYNSLGKIEVFSRA